MAIEWEADQFVDVLADALELACGQRESIDVEDVHGWYVRPLYETRSVFAVNEGLEVETPRGVFVLVVHKLADHELMDRD